MPTNRLLMRRLFLIIAHKMLKSGSAAILPHPRSDNFSAYIHADSPFPDQRGGKSLPLKFLLPSKGKVRMGLP